MKPVYHNNEKLYPSKIVCIGRNYVDHIKELNNEIPTQAVIFNKPNSALSDEIKIEGNEPIHYEGEISFIVKSGQLKAVAFGLDLTKREIQSQLKAKGLPWERAKAFDGAALFSKFVSINGNINDLRMELFINNSLMQSGGCESMILKPENILNEINTFMTLEDGDIIMTGTPKGVGVINHRDTFIGKIFDKDKLLLESTWHVK